MNEYDEQATTMKTKFSTGKQYLNAYTSQSKSRYACSKDTTTTTTPDTHQVTNKRIFVLLLFQYKGYLMLRRISRSLSNVM
jgi:hypothetical protein